MNLPKFMIRQTGGLAVGAISTKSRLACFAFSSASAIGTTPRASPDSPIKRTSFHRICSLTRMLFLSILPLRNHFLHSPLDCPAGNRLKLDNRHRPGVAAVPESDGCGPRARLFFADDQHRGNFLELGFPNPRPELLVAVVD